MFVPLLIIYSEYIISIMAASAMLLSSYKKRSHFALRIVLLILILAISSVIWTLIGCAAAPTNNIPSLILSCILYLSLLVAIIAVSYMCFKGSFSSILFSCITGYAIKQLTENIFFILVIIFPSINLTYSSQDNPLYVIMLRYYAIKIPFYAVCFASLYLLYLRKHCSIIPDRETNYPALIFASITMVSCLVFNILRDNFVNDNTIMNVVCILSCALCFILIIFLRTGLLEKNSLEIEVALIKRIHHEKEDQFNLFKDNLDIINIKYHDLKKSLNLLKTINIKTSAREEVINEIEKALNIYDAKIKTGNELLDTILTRYNLLAERSEIRLSCIAEGKLLEFISTTDLVALFSNILDNAINAAKQLPPDKRSISLSIQSECAMVSIHCENSYAGTIHFRNELPASQNKDVAYHGFGMKSIRMIAEKYDGNLSIIAEDGVFRINIIFPPAE